MEVMVSLFTVEALSIVYPAVTDIAAGRKIIEIRSWRPPRLPLCDLALVENHRYLREEGDEDADGRILAVVDVVGVHEWTQAEAERDGKVWSPGYFAWELANIGRWPNPFRLPRAGASTG
jgi:hypothetical protein